MVLYLLIDRGYQVALEIGFLSQNQLTGSAEASLRHLMDLPIWLPLFLVFLISCLTHLFLALIIRKHKKVALKHQPIIWLDNSWTFGLLMVVLAVIIGLSNLTILLFIILAALVFILLNGLLDLLKANKQHEPVKLVLAVLRLMAGVTPFVILALSLLASVFYSGHAVGFYHLLIYLALLLFALALLFLNGLIAVKVLNKKSKQKGKKAKLFAFSGDSLKAGSDFLLKSVVVWLIFFSL